MSVSIEPGALETIERRARNGVSSPVELLRVIAYAKDLLRRNEALSREYRIASNTAEQLAVPLGKVRELVAGFNSGEVELEAFVAGVAYWTTN
ncbi:hypothetical protein [Antrihabitans cavernicola]|uniref:Uncharacterized protein n=1 Tax=Antrihabitans cavernicola TaxID=2495913 RepID=A0A5A7S8M1_9NOCA|nr:hypothetical protein [Spelaeibacter cavernicola]KAA0021824.1 hypothetical protein FOY51_15620 [Spelaeibacter cavernicola]